MTDLTADFNICLKEKGAASLAIKKDYDLESINSFLQEAYSINKGITSLIRELRDIRPSYLSAAQPSRRRQQGAESQRFLSDKERDAFDASSKQILRELNRAITSLKQTADVGHQAAESAALSKRAGGGMLGRWVAGGAVTSKSPEEEREEAARNTVYEVRKSIIMFLQEKLGEAGMIQGEMMDVRLNREMEKSKSILAKSPIAGGVPRAWDEDGSVEPPSASSYKRASTGMPDGEDRQGLSQEQLQVFEEENHELVKHYENQLDQVRTVEQSILEISELQSILHANLTQQSEKIDQLVQDSYLTTENLGKGNKELKRASERRSTAQALFFSTVAFCSFLVVWDLIF